MFALMDYEETDSGSDSTPPLSGDTTTLSQFIENMGLHFEEYGVPRIGGRILGLLLASSRPVSSEEMSESARSKPQQRVHQPAHAADDRTGRQGFSPRRT